MDLIISNSSTTPIYEQIKNQIKDKIILGKLKPGAMLPSIRSLARDLRVSVITTKNAYDQLEREGYVKTISAKGTYVAHKNADLIREEQLQKIEHLIDTAVTVAKISSITKDELIAMLDILYEEKNS